MRAQAAIASRCAMTSSRGAGNLEELVRVAAGAGIGRRGQHVLGLGIVQRVIEQGDGGNRIAEGRMRRDIFDPVAVDVDFAPVAQGLEELSPGERAFLAFENCFGGLRHGAIRNPVHGWRNGRPCERKPTRPAVQM